MMTKEEHINYWVNTAENDWTVAWDTFDTKNYMHCLFWVHLVLEKLAKAHWVRTHEENIPPKIHNVVWLLKQSDIDFGEETMKFLEDFNDFQLSGRYPDYTNRIYRMCTEEFTSVQLEKVKEVRTCLLKMLS
jgi:HEPN domain-containing protein